MKIQKLILLSCALNISSPGDTLFNEAKKTDSSKNEILSASATKDYTKNDAKGLIKIYFIFACIGLIASAGFFMHAFTKTFAYGTDGWDGNLKTATGLRFNAAFVFFGIPACCFLIHHHLNLDIYNIAQESFSSQADDDLSDKVQRNVSKLNATCIPLTTMTCLLVWSCIALTFPKTFSNDGLGMRRRRAIPLVIGIAICASIICKACWSNGYDVTTRMLIKNLFK